jgi:hypothetical protein
MGSCDGTPGSFWTQSAYEGGYASAEQAAAAVKNQSIRDDNARGDSDRGDNVNRDGDGD